MGIPSKLVAGFLNIFGAYFVAVTVVAPFA
jgi:hypothetical protein